MAKEIARPIKLNKDIHKIEITRMMIIPIE